MNQTLKICALLSFLLQIRALVPNARRGSASILSPQTGVSSIPQAAHKNVIPTRFFAKKDSQERGGAIHLSSSSSSPISDNKLATLIGNIQEQFRLRVEADPNFVSKSITEVFLAAAAQLTAEIGRRGKSGIWIEIDFVVAGILTAIAGKYYSMWRTAPTASPSSKRDADGNISKAENTESDSRTQHKSRSSSLPTNAFQTNRPYTIAQRGLSFIVPIPALFRAGFIASGLGYGLTSLLIFLRSSFVPSYEAATVNVNVLHACLYTGGFMAVVSNIRYQLLQGVVEPQIIERIFRRFPVVQAAMIFLVRLANGLLGSSLAIAGMKMFGLQKRK